MDDSVERLRAYGRRPVDPALQSQHLTAIAAVPGHRSFGRVLASRARIAAAVLAGFALGTTGLASAGALGPLQPVAAVAVEKATPLKVPKGPAEKAAKAKAKAEKTGGTPRFTDGCVPAEDGTFARNRGQYLKQERAKGADALAAADASECGKPLVSIGKDDEADDPAKVDDGTETDSGDPGEAEKTDKVTDDQGKADCVDNGKSAEEKAKEKPTKPAATGKPACTPGTAEDHPTTPEATPAVPGANEHLTDRAKDASSGGASDGHGDETPAEDTTPETPTPDPVG